MSVKRKECPCGGPDYDQCCGRFLDGDGLPADAQQLMRSRYTAYVLGRGDWILQTWHTSTRPAPPVTGDGVKWLGLDVKRHVPAGDKAVVEFVARYREGGRGQRLHECSNFVHENGRWWYVDGSFPGKDK